MPSFNQEVFKIDTLKMSLASDLTLNCNKFRGDSIRHSTVKINGHLESLPTNEIKWYEVCCSINLGVKHYLSTMLKFMIILGRCALL